MIALRANAPVEKAVPVLERFAYISAEIDAIELNREKALANINATADLLLAELIKERAELTGTLQAWWERNGSTLTFGKRKSLVLGGCTIGTKTLRAKLSLPGDDKAASSALQAHRWAKPYLRVTVSVDKVAVNKGLDGKHGDQLRALGFGMTAPGEEFELARVAQPGTVAG